MNLFGSNNNKQEQKPPELNKDYSRQLTKAKACIEKMKLIQTKFKEEDRKLAIPALRELQNSLNQLMIKLDNPSSLSAPVSRLHASNQAEKTTQAFWAESSDSRQPLFYKQSMSEINNVSCTLVPALEITKIHADDKISTISFKSQNSFLATIKDVGMILVEEGKVLYRKKPKTRGRNPKISHFWHFSLFWLKNTQNATINLFLSRLLPR